MIINRIVINGFGCFSNWEGEEFSQGLNIIYGQNEAGKSTLLNILSSVFYGLEKNGAQKFQPLSGGTFGARVEVSDQTEKYIISRSFGKSGKASISKSNGEKLEASALSAILGGADRIMFSRLFAFGLDELNDLDKLLDVGKGISERIFTAGVEGAGASAQKTLKNLSENISEIFSPKSSDNFNFLLQSLESCQSELARLLKEDYLYKEIGVRELALSKELIQKKELIEELGLVDEKIGAVEKEIINRDAEIRAKILVQNEKLAADKLLIKKNKKLISILGILAIIILLYAGWHGSYFAGLIGLLCLGSSLFLYFTRPKTTNHAVGESDSGIENRISEVSKKLNSIFPDEPIVKSLSEARKTSKDKQDVISKQLAALSEQLGRVRQERERLEASKEIEQTISERDLLKNKLRESFKRFASHLASRTIIQSALDNFLKNRQPEVFLNASSLFSAVVPEYERIVFAHDTRSISVITRRGQIKELMHLSRGTLEQLYLCIRLGLIEEFRKHRIALPIIMDDILVNTDLQRSEKFLKLLANFSNNHQVLFFTCHQWLLELAKSSCDGCRIIEIK